MPLVRFQLKCPKPKDFVENPRRLGEHLRKRRLELGLTLRQVGQATDVTEFTVINWESGEHDPAMANWPAILHFLGYDPFRDTTTLGDRLRRFRRAHGWTIRQAADHLQIDPATWGAWEAGGLVLFVAHRAAIARLLGLDAHAFDSEMRQRWNPKHHPKHASC